MRPKSNRAAGKRPPLVLLLILALTSPLVSAQNGERPPREAPAPEWLSAKELVLLEDARTTASNLREELQHIPKRDLGRLALDYTVYAEVRGISIKIECRLSIEADPELDNTYQARFDLGTVRGHGTLDRVVVSLGKVIGKVPDTKWHLRSVLRLQGSGLFQSLKYWESPKPKFLGRWRQVLRDRRMAAAYRNRLNKPGKSAKLEAKAAARQARLWSPFLVEFGQGPNGSIRFKKNHVDGSADWESEQLPDQGQTDPLGAILNFMIMGGQGQGGIPIINLFRKGDKDAKGKKIPRFIFEEIQLKIGRIPEREAGLYPPCNLTARIEGGQGLAQMFKQLIYFHGAASETPAAGDVFSPNPVSFITFGDIMQESKGVPKVFAGNVRAYLTSAAFSARDTVD